MAKKLKKKNLLLGKEVNIKEIAVDLDEALNSES